MEKKSGLLALLAVCLTLHYSDPALSANGRFGERRAQDQASSGVESSRVGLYVRGKGTSKTETVDGRRVIVYIPPTTSSSPMPLVVALHGGMGNATKIQNYIGLEPYADKYGFMIAYPDGTPVAQRLLDNGKGWNAGECCGLPQRKKVDDVAFINALAQHVVRKYKADPERIYGVGHSNGGMMTYRMLCESNVYKGAVIYAGTLELDTSSCPVARGKSILALHGAKDENVPPAGGYTIIGINKNTNYRSQDYTIRVFTNSGANYTHTMLPNAAHMPETINADLIATQNVTLPQKIVTFLGLGNP